MIPTTRNEAYALLEGVDWDPGRLTHEQVLAVREVYRLDSFESIADAVKRGKVRGCSRGLCFTDSTVCGSYDTEECPHRHHTEAPM
jgi:hypothetical protein